MSSPTRRQMLQTVLAGLTSEALIKSPDASAGTPAEMRAQTETASGTATASVSWKSPSIPIEQRVRDLLSRMTLEEKVEEISGGRPSNAGILDNTGRFNGMNAAEAFRQLYSMEGKHLSVRDAAILRNALQRYRLEKTRLGIPAIFQGEALHGFMSFGATSFPQAIGLASAWDTDLMREVFTAAADEMASSGVNQAFTPVINLGRDPRWGRTEETYGEDPFLTSRLGVAAIQGLQGTNFLIDRHHVLATAKHFAAYGETRGGRNDAPADFPERELRQVFFAAFEAAVKEAQVGSVMAAYNEIDSVPCHINRWLLTRILREEWGFQGYVTSDGGGLEMLVDYHHAARDNAQAARLAIAAGVDYDLSNGAVYHTLAEQVRNGTVSERHLDRAVSAVLACKFRLGLFENPYVDPDYAQNITNCKAHQALALRAAERTPVLLKNENNLLPIDIRKVRTIAVIGPNARDLHLGGYSRDPGRGVTVLEGIRDYAGTRARVLFSEGCQITLGPHGWSEYYRDKIELPDPATQPAMIKAAVQIARKADVAIVVAGGNEGTCREAWSQKHLGDRDSLDLLGAQDELIRAVVETGTPTVLVLINGRPLSINYAAAHVPAILECWYLGQEGGTALARILFGEVSPGGKLPITFPRSVGQLPAYYNYKPSAIRSYAFADSTPLFPFGHGLSYTTFRIDNPVVTPSTIAPEGTATLTVDVTNAGTREGDEVVQMYIHRPFSPITQPIIQLKGFRRITLKPGQKAKVEFRITPELLAIYDLDMRPRVVPGEVELRVGSSSTQAVSTPLRIVAG
ncbi:MAG TPA: glycoside hydrolase family 3 N-terminal domain-containing protein [Terriglobia bacterium]|nr:glycoside hydrolase family 3 N-terminal domain-containing protein [Terriglobia bacterium]